MDLNRRDEREDRPGSLTPSPGGRRWRGLAWALGVAWGMGFGGFGGDARGGVSFNRDIRPILSEHCFACHGPDEKARKAGLRLDLETHARTLLDSGRRAVVGGDLDASELWARISTGDSDDLMPPAETKKPLSPAKVALLRQWLAEGAPYQGHWAYLPPERTEPPAVNRVDWPRNDIDRFILGRLEREGLAPSAEASKETLLRRVTLDLTGLPPTVEELDAFLADPGAGAYEAVVDRLLASPHYGERMAQQWLDLARYGETQGYHHDRHRDMWHWRDWVIEAFNRNQPFDQFTVEQLAGDLLPEPTRDQLVATGFHRNEMTTSEGGALPEEYIVKYAVGRVDTTARVWLGTSMACAECHDHKYDPISLREYYQFFAFFFDTPEHGLDREELNPVPRVTLETPEQREYAARLDRDVAALEAAEDLAFTAPRPAWDDAQEAWEAAHRGQSVGGWKPLAGGSVRVQSLAEHPPDADGVVPLGQARPGGAPETVIEWVAPTDLPGLNGLRLDLLPEDGGPGAGGTNGVLLTRVEVVARSRDAAREADAVVPPQLGTWHQIGPFAAGSAKEAWDREYGPERDADLRARWDEGRRAWEARGEVPGGDFGILEAGGARVTYFTVTLTAPEGRLTEWEVAGHGGVRLWRNGESFEVRAGSGTGSDAAPDRVRVWLPRGESRVLLKVVHGKGDRPFVFRLRPGAVTEATVELAGAASDGHAGDHHVRGALDDRADTGWAPGGWSSAVRTATFRARQPVGFAVGTELRVRLHFGGGAWSAPAGGVRLAVAASPTLAEFLELPDGVRRALGVEPSRQTADQRAEVRRAYRERHVPEAQQARQLLAAKRKERDAFRNAWPTAMVMQAADPSRETRIRVRGQYNELGDRVEPGVPTHLFPWQEGLPRNRLGLARWLVDPRHPLTARVIVNQYWQRYFGTGLVKTAEDFGSQGDWPSHPELLDWLATEFVRTGWDVKAMQRLLVTSATYRQEARVTPALLERDPENRLLARGPRFRLEAENIRDVALRASGLLEARVGGPSVFPYQPPGLWGQVSFEGTRDYAQSEGADNYRRGLYTYWRRSIPYAAFTVFDAPSREVCTVRRPRTNTPLQALALMNDPVYVEAARALATRILRHTATDLDARIDYAFRLVLGRRPTAREVEVLTAACRREFERYAQDREGANRLIHVGASRPPVDVDIAELAAWTVVASTLLNLDETITKG